jgi:hypothetical protein
MNNKKKPNLTNFLNSLIKKITPDVLRNLHRPDNIPLNATDCGFNHGEPKKETVKLGDEKSLKDEKVAF